MQSQTGEVASVNISEETGTIKQPRDVITVDGSGVVGDAHAGNWHRQVSLLSEELITGFAKEIGREIAPGEFAENITTRGIDLGQVAVLDLFRIGDVSLEVTQIGKACHGDTCAIFREVGKCVMPKEGIFARVARSGEIKPGDELVHQPRALQFWVITVSDRASRGEYEDKSGPRIVELIEDFLNGKRWHPQIHTAVVADDPAQLKIELQRAQDARADVVVTTGGTGIGPRDNTPEVVVMSCSKLIPGVMEHIRTKYGAEHPGALLSRGVAGVMGHGLIYTLPGSPRACGEYMGEILKTLEHLLMMLHGIDAH